MIGWKSNSRPAQSESKCQTDLDYKSTHNFCSITDFRRFSTNGIINRGAHNGATFAKGTSELRLIIMWPKGNLMDPCFFTGEYKTMDIISNQFISQYQSLVPVIWTPRVKLTNINFSLDLWYTYWYTLRIENTILATKKINSKNISLAITILQWFDHMNGSKSHFTQHWTRSFLFRSVHQSHYKIFPINCKMLQAFAS